MTAFSSTFSAAVNVFGGAPTDLWLSYNWNAFQWGQGTATLPKIFVHLLAGQSITGSAAEDFRLVRLLTAQTQPSTAAVNVRLRIMLNGQSIGQADTMAHEYVQDPRGYFRVYPEQVTDLTKRSTPSWAAGAATPVTWTTQVAGTTVWS